MEEDVLMKYLYLIVYRVEFICNGRISLETKRFDEYVQHRCLMALGACGFATNSVVVENLMQ